MNDYTKSIITIDVLLNACMMRQTRIITPCNIITIYKRIVFIRRRGDLQGRVSSSRQRDRTHITTELAGIGLPLQYTNSCIIYNKSPSDVSIVMRYQWI